MPVNFAEKKPMPKKPVKTYDATTITEVKEPAKGPTMPQQWDKKITDFQGLFPGISQESWNQVNKPIPIPKEDMNQIRKLLNPDPAIPIPIEAIEQLIHNTESAYKRDAGKQTNSMTIVNIVKKWLATVK